MNMTFLALKPTTDGACAALLPSNRSTAIHNRAFATRQAPLPNKSAVKRPRLMSAEI